MNELQAAGVEMLAVDNAHNWMAMTNRSPFLILVPTEGDELQAPTEMVTFGGWGTLITTAVHVELGW